MGIKGQKVNPVGWRLGFYRKWKNSWFEESWNYGLMLNKTLKVNEIIESFLLYKRFPSLNIKSLLINKGTEEFILVIHFYNFREEETKSVKKKRRKFRGLKRFKSLRILWTGEEKFLNKKKKKQFFKNIDLIYKNFLVFQNINGNSLTKFYDLLEFSKENKTLPPFKSYFKNKMFKHSFQALKKIEFVDFSIFRTSEGISDYAKSNQSLTFTRKIFFQKEQLTQKSLISFCKNFSIFFLEKNFFFFCLLLKSLIKKTPNVYFNQLYKNITNVSNVFTFSQHYFLHILNSKRYYFDYFLEKNANSINTRNKLPSFNGVLSKRLKNGGYSKKKYDLLQSLASKHLLEKNLIDSFPVLEKKKRSKLPKRLFFKKLFIMSKLILTRSNALKKKFDRFGLANNAFIWKWFLYPTLTKFRESVFRKKTRLFKRDTFLVNYIEEVNQRLYNQRENGSFRYNQENKVIHKIDKTKAFLFKLQRLLVKRKTLVNPEWFFSLDHLKKTLEIILKSKIDIFFINVVSLMKFKTFLVPSRDLKEVKSFGKKFIWQKLRLAKINSNRQYQKLLKEPFLIERRGKRQSPFLKDFVFLVLISFITRSFKPLLKFIDYQIRNLAKGKRQLPFLRFLIRLITKLAGNLVRLKGFRIQFKGRFDRWNRTKSLIFTSGNIPFQRKDRDIEYASTHGLVKKGTFGIRFWVWYGKDYHKTYSKLFLSYWLFNQFKN